MLASWHDHRAWRQINFRRTTTLLAAEFLHGLYQRHNPFLNPFRFANTVVVFRPWESASYAPRQEWDRLAVRFGTRFLREHERTCAELDAVLANDRPRSRALAGMLAGLDLGGLNDAELAERLVELHHVPLGEIYEVNLVQVEHALHAAVRAMVEDGAAQPSDVDRILSSLSMSEVTTMAGAAERSFLELVLQTRATQDGAVDDAALAGIMRQHAELGAAYGADTVTLAAVRHRFRQYLALPERDLRARLDRLLTPAAPPPCPDPQARRLVELLRRTGEVRDCNKQLLGTITRHRGRFLEEVARRTGVAPEDLRLYLLEEVLRLVEDGASLPSETVRRRAESGVVLARHEAAALPEQTGLPRALLAPPDAGSGDGGGARLRGVCAAPGRHTGTARIVTSAADLTRMRVGDVVVAPGTDFDLVLLLQMAGAIVTEEGGLLSHAAVVARELDIPCLVGVTGARRCISEGDLVTVDAEAGHVTVRPDQALAESPRPAAGATRAPTLLVPLRPGQPVEVTGRKAAGLLALCAEGLPVPEPTMLVPTRAAAAVGAALERGEHGPAYQVAAEILGAMRTRRLCLRSSSVIEDMPDATAAGIYHSEVDVPADLEAVVAALRRVLASRTGARAKAYHARAGRDHDVPLAVLVMPYTVFELQGTAVSHSPASSDHVMVEWYESDGHGGCPDTGGEAVHFSHGALVVPRPAGGIPSVTRSLREVAAACLRMSAALGGAVELEWGLADEDLTLLQARRVGGRVAALAAEGGRGEPG